MRKTIISIILLMVAAYLFIQGVTCTTSWPQNEDITIALYVVGAAIVFAIALIPWAKE